MTITINSRTFVGISSLALQRQSDNLVLNWPQPETFNVSTNVEQRVQTSRSEQGRKVRSGSYVVGEMPTLSINYTYIQPEMVGFMVGNQMASGSFATMAPKTLEVTAGTVAGAASGYLFNGIADDPSTSQASVTRAGISTMLTRQPYATFDGASPANDDSYAVGADGALKFSDNLVTNRDIVTVLIPVSVSGLKLSDVLIGPHRLYAKLVNTENKITLFEARSVTPDLEGRSLDFGGESLEMNIFLNNPPGECRAWQLIETELQVPCN